MTVVSTSILRKQQSTPPTSMRYERVQEILQGDPFLKTKLGPRTQEVDTRFGEKARFSKEVFEVTNAIHQEGKDAHKLPKIEVLRVAMRVMKIIPPNGDMRPVTTLTVPPPVNQIDAATPVPSLKNRGRTRSAAKAKSSTEKAASKRKSAKATVSAVKVPKSKRQTIKATAPATTENKSSKPVKTARASARAKPEPPVSQPVIAPDDKNPVGEKDEEQVPESELPLEQQPLHLPAEYDPRKYPHYNVQSTLYSLLLSALNLSDHFEKFAGFEERQKDLEALVKKYLATCDPIKLGT